MDMLDFRNILRIGGSLSAWPFHMRPSDGLFLGHDFRLLLVILIMLFLGRELDVRDHEPVVVGVGQVDGVISGVSLFMLCEEWVGLGRVEFKWFLHSNIYY